MSYGIQLMKEAVSGSNPGYGVKNMFILLSFGAAALIGLQIVDLVKYHRKKKEKTVIPPESLSEVLR